VVPHEWVVDMLANLPQGITASNVVLVLDNAPCHSRMEEVEENIPGFKILRLGPYLPMLNPIENIWSKIKSHIKTNMRLPNVAPPNVGEQRLSFLEGLVDNAMATISPRDCAQCTQHALSLHAGILNIEDVQPGQ